jgi:hypothetical protein
MKQARKAFGRWVQRITGKPRAELPTQPGQQRLQELDAQALAKVGGGVQATAETPFKGW